MYATATPRPPRSNGATLRGAPEQARAVGDSLTIALDAEPRTVRAALRRADLAAPVARALGALDLTGRVVLGPAVVGPARSGGLVLGLVWRIRPVAAAEQRIEPRAFEAIASPGYVKVRSEVEVRPAGDHGSFLSIATRFTATDDDSHARLLDAWGVLGPLSRSLARRAAATVRGLAEAEHETGSEMAA